WTKIRRIDSDAGDTMIAALSSASHSQREDRRDPTFVRYEMLVDIYANNRNVASKYEPAAFYGQLQHIYLIYLNNADPMAKYGIGRAECFIMLEIQECTITSTDERVDTHNYTNMGSTHAADATVLQCLLGRVPVTERQWTIVDRSGSLARAVYLDNDGN
ncbi:hypothetical protein C8F01DRAFT_971037, partial [Mycena amicta]